MKQLAEVQIIKRKEEDSGDSERGRRGSSRTLKTADPLGFSQHHKHLCALQGNDTCSDRENASLMSEVIGQNEQTGRLETHTEASANSSNPTGHDPGLQDEPLCRHGPGAACV